MGGGRDGIHEGGQGVLSYNGNDRSHDYFRRVCARALRNQFTVLVLSSDSRELTVSQEVNVSIQDQSDDVRSHNSPICSLMSHAKIEVLRELRHSI